MAKILTIEDLSAGTPSLTALLDAGGFEIEHVSRGREGIARAITNSYGLVAIDRYLPDLDGLQIVTTLRHTGYASPLVIMAEEASSTQDRVNGLRSGCDDYLARPFDADEIIARVESLLRRHPAPAARPSVLSVDELSLDFVRQELTYRDKVLHLRPTELRLIECLMRHKGKALSRATLLETVWGAGFSANSNLVDVHVGRLRGKLDIPGHPSLIRTVRGTGYLLRG